jgi:hypothetical protein
MTSVDKVAYTCRLGGTGYRIEACRNALRAIPIVEPAAGYKPIVMSSIAIL